MVDVEESESVCNDFSPRLLLFPVVILSVFGCHLLISLPFLFTDNVAFSVLCRHFIC